MTVLLEWLWQGTAIAAALAIALRCAPRVNASTRYGLWWLALAAILALPALEVWTSPMNPWALPATSGAGLGNAPAPPTPAPDRGPFLQVPMPPDWVIASLMGAWFGSVLLGLGRMAAGARTVQRLKASSRALPAAVERTLRARGGWPSGAAGRRAPEVRWSDAIAGACALGLWGEQVILISRRFMDRLGAEDLDLIVMHEQAHLARRDDWAALVQSGVMTVFGLHPGVRLACAALDVEREAACDDAVAARIGSARRYAACLADAADVMAVGRMHAAPALAPHVARTGSFVARVERLLDARVPHRVTVQRLAMGGGALALATALLGARLADPLVGVSASTVPGPTAVVVRMTENPGRRAVRAVDDAVALPERRQASLSSGARPEAPARRSRPVARPRKTGTFPPAGQRAVLVADTSDAEDRRGAASPASRPSPSAGPTAGAVPGSGPLSAVPRPFVDLSIGTGTDQAGVVHTGSAAAPGWSAVGLHVAQGGVAVGERVARGGTAVGAFFSRAGKAVAGQF